MSHIHLPDGVLPFVWWFTADLLAAAWLLLSLRQAGRQPKRRSAPLVAAMGAFMLLTMSVPLGPLPLQLNLTILTGMMAGPWLGFMAVFLVNAMLSLLGHGGFTALGLNSLIMGVEVTLGWWAFHRLLKPWAPAWRAVCAVVLALTVSTALSLSLVGWSTGAWTAALPHPPGAQGASQELATQPAAGPNQAAQSLSTAISGWGVWGMSGMWALGCLLSLGLLVEALATLTVTRYLLQVRPELLETAEQKWG